MTIHIAPLRDMPANIVFQPQTREFTIIAGEKQVIRENVPIRLGISIALPEGYNVRLSLAKGARRRCFLTNDTIDNAFRSEITLPIQLLRLKKPWRIQKDAPLAVITFELIPNYISPKLRAKHNAAMLRTRLLHLQDPDNNPAPPPMHFDPRVDARPVCVRDDTDTIDGEIKWHAVTANVTPNRLIDISSAYIRVRGLDTLSLFDTGSTVTSTDYAYVRKCFPGLRIQQTRTVVRGFEAVGQVTLRIAVGDQSWNQTFVVLRNNPRPMVIGLDTMVRRHIVVIAAEHRITITTNGKSVDIPTVASDAKTAIPVPISKLLRLDEDITLPPQTEAAALVKHAATRNGPLPQQLLVKT